jgi:hypothetical protein
MPDLLLPAGLFILVLFLSFCLCSWYFKQRYIRPMLRRIRRLERYVRGAGGYVQPQPPTQTYQHYTPLDERYSYEEE